MSKTKYTVKASKQAKIMSATDFRLPEFPIETDDILERLGFTTISDDLWASNNGDDLIVTDAYYSAVYYSNIPDGQKDELLGAIIEEDSFPELPESFIDSTVEEDEYYSIGDLLEAIVGSF